MDNKRVRFESPSSYSLQNSKPSRKRCWLAQCFAKKEKKRESILNICDAISTPGQERVEIMVLNNSSSSEESFINSPSSSLEKKLPKFPRPPRNDSPRLTPRVNVFYSPTLSSSNESNFDFNSLPYKELNSLNPRKSSLKLTDHVLMNKLEVEFSEDEVAYLSFWNRAEEVDFQQDRLIESMMGLAI